MNQGVDVPNMTFSTSAQTSSVVQVLEQTSDTIDNTASFSFTYEDYLEFLLLFEKILSSQTEENENTKYQTQQSDSPYNLYETSKLPSLTLAQMLDL